MKLTAANAHTFNAEKLTAAMIKSKLTNHNLAKKIAESEGLGKDTDLIQGYSVYIGRMQGANGGRKQIDGDFLDLIEKVLGKKNIKGTFVPSIKKYDTAIKKKENKNLLLEAQSVLDPKDDKGYFAKLTKAFFG